jgi:site-specific DNA-methyltransferase (adenine-specific)
MNKPYKLWTGDCREVVGYGYAENTFDSIVCDPPYGLEFMDKAWDKGVPGVEFWTHALRAAKPGAHLLAFGGTRTFHRLACAIEDAGWEIRDCIMWVYGSGFPKSLDVSKALDKAAGAEREVVGTKRAGLGTGDSYGKIVGERSPVETDQVPVTVPATDAAKQWDGWGTALKPAWEPIIVARKPLAGTVAQNVLKHGTGGMNIDGCRIPMGDEYDPTKMHHCRTEQPGHTVTLNIPGFSTPTYKPGGRWPSNFIHDGSEEVVGLFPVTGPSKVRRLNGDEAKPPVNAFGDYQRRTEGGVDDEGGSAARFFYCAKASRKDREEGCEHLPTRTFATNKPYGGGAEARAEGEGSGARNHHATVKPTDLMRYLVRLVTAPGGLVLDPFMGSGSTGKAAMLEGMRFVGVDLNAEYVEIAKSRIEHALTARTELEGE